MQLQSMPSADGDADAPASEARPVTPERPGSEDAPACDAAADDDDAREQSLAKALDSHGAHRHGVAALRRRRQRGPLRGCHGLLRKLPSSKRHG